VGLVRVESAEGWGIVKIGEKAALVRRADIIMEALEQGHSTMKEMVRYCKEEKGLPESSIYNTLTKERSKGLIAVMTIETNGGDEEVFVPWSPALQQLFFLVDKSSHELGGLLEGSLSRGFSVGVKSSNLFHDCSARVAIVSCLRNANPADIERSRLNTQSSTFTSSTYESFSLFRIHEGKVLLGQKEFQPACAVNIALFSLNCTEVFLHVPYFINLMSQDGPHRILKVETAKQEKPRPFVSTNFELSEV
jgi:hypothetical protein